MIKLSVAPRPTPRAEGSGRRRYEAEWYTKYKQEIFIEARKQNFELGKVFEVVFIIPMPKSWKKKRREKNLTPHDALSGPDLDNLVKGFMDALLHNDSKCWHTPPTKLWGYEGAIYINNLDEEIILNKVVGKILAFEVG